MREEIINTLDKMIERIEIGFVRITKQIEDISIEINPHNIAITDGHDVYITSNFWQAVDALEYALNQ